MYTNPFLVQKSDRTRTALFLSIPLLLVTLLLTACGGAGQPSGQLPATVAVDDDNIGAAEGRAGENITAPTVTVAEEHAQQTATTLAEQTGPTETAIAANPPAGEDIGTAEPVPTSMSENAMETRELLKQTPHVTQTKVPQDVRTLSDFADNPDEYAGQVITVQGVITNAVGMRLFELRSPTDKGRVLVFSTEEDVTIAEGDALQTTGEVMLFDLVTIEERTGLDLEDDLFVDIAEQPVILAETFTDPPSTADVSPVMDESQPMTRTMEPAENIALSDIATNPTEYEGQVVTVQGTIANPLGERIFELQSMQDDATVLVLSTEEDISIAAGDDVQVTGQMMLFDLVSIGENEEIDLDDNLVVDAEGEPVIIADMFEMMASDE
jgi:hypothetical protein